MTIESVAGCKPRFIGTDERGVTLRWPFSPHLRFSDSSGANALVCFDPYFPIADAAQLTGVVTAESVGNALEGAIVSIPQPGMKTTTNRSGFSWSGGDGPGQYTVFVRSVGAEDLATAVLVDEAGVSTRNDRRNPFGRPLPSRHADGYRIITDQRKTTNRFHLFDRASLKHRALFKVSAPSTPLVFGSRRRPWRVSPRGLSPPVTTTAQSPAFDVAGILTALGLSTHPF